MTIEKIDQDRCIGCGTCVSTCPADVIRLDKTSGKAAVTYAEDCQSCHLCRLFCPVGNDLHSISSSAAKEPTLSWG